MKPQIEAILSDVVPNAFWYVQEYTNGFTNKKETKIVIAATQDEINNVKGQYPACVSLLLENETKKLDVQIFGGMGGNFIYRLPNKEIPSEFYLALKSIKIPFRRPQPKEEAILKAIKKFAENWKATVKENLGKFPYNYDYAGAVK